MFNTELDTTAIINYRAETIVRHAYIKCMLVWSENYNYKRGHSSLVVGK